ncbi:hypothetical protein PybrP1_005364, partial [[Pythium] brassicae (nom. inval.)]
MSRVDVENTEESFTFDVDTVYGNDARRGSRGAAAAPPTTDRRRAISAARALAGCSVLDLQHHEPAFWQLRIVEFVRSTLEAQVGTQLVVREDASSEGLELGVAHAADSWSTEALEARRHAALELVSSAAQSVTFIQAKEQIYSALHSVLLRLSVRLDDPEPPSIATHGRVKSQRTTHFLELLWRELSDTVCESERLIGEEAHVEPEDLDGAQSYSFEAISFDDLNDACGSACSDPSFEDIPDIMARLQQPDARVQQVALDELLRVPVLELVHCGANFASLCSTVARLFLLTDPSRSDVKAKQLVYDLLCHAEDALVFRDIYWSVLAFVGRGAVLREKARARLARQSGGRRCGRVSAAAARNAARGPPLAALLAGGAREVAGRDAAGTGHEPARMRRERRREARSTHQGGGSARPQCGLVPSVATQGSGQRAVVRCAGGERVCRGAASASVSRPAARGLKEFESRVGRSRASSGAACKRMCWDRGGKAGRDGISSIAQALCIMSYLSEFRDGRRILSSWQRRPAHVALKARRARWVHPDELRLECKPDENDRVYHLARPPSLDGGLSEDKKDDVERLGDKILDALVMSIVAVRFTHERFCSIKLSADTTALAPRAMYSWLYRVSLLCNAPKLQTRRASGRAVRSR